MGNSALVGTAVAVAGATAVALYAWDFASSGFSIPADAKGKRPMSSPTVDEQEQEPLSLDELRKMFFADCRTDQASEVADRRHLSQNPKPRPPLTKGIIKIMSYNIWSLEDVKLHERMTAIGQLIQKHSPDVILLQEVTPMIYRIFQGCNWWSLYRCSVPQEKATKKKWFCMLLSKLPVKKFFIKNFENTSKELCVAKIKSRKEKKLVVATCHLKRPTPPEMNSIERVKQAKEALKHLQHGENVILGGDMNWDESCDGSFPLLGQWRDAWSDLKPKEDGWTYDTHSNLMMNCSRSLQRRLDRFIYKLKDYKLINIELIGTDAIPGVSYKNNRKKLPVLPSDHYGLILTICPKL